MFQDFRSVYQSASLSLIFSPRPIFSSSSVSLSVILSQYGSFIPSVSFQMFLSSFPNFSFLPRAIPIPVSKVIVSQLLQSTTPETFGICLMHLRIWLTYQEVFVLAGIMVCFFSLTCSDCKDLLEPIHVAGLPYEIDSKSDYDNQVPLV